MAKRKMKKHHFGHAFSRILLTILLVGVLCACFCGMAFAYYVHAYINPTVEEDVLNIGMDLNSFIYAIDPDTGEEYLYETLKGRENRIWVGIDQIPENLKNAVVAIEDQRFYEHKGVDWKRTFGAAVNWVGGSSTYGGSTITQQLIKNMTSEDDFSVKRKVIEIFRALALEDSVGDKTEILERYLNTIFLGRNTYGVKTAAATYFGKDVSELDLAECAVLAGITNNPSYYDPYTYPEHIKERQETILDQMLKQGMITQEEHDAAKAQELNYRSIELYEDDLSEPYSYFTDEVIKEVISDLVKEKGYSELIAEDLVYSGGLKIYATINKNIQQIMDEEYNNDDNFPNMVRDDMIPQSAMVITDKKGNIQGIVGGRGEKTGKRTFSLATDARRQPGSAIKPLAAYGPAMDKGIIVPTSSVYDRPIMTLNGKLWPRNDSNRYSYGPMVIKSALAHSVNTIAVNLVDMLTPQASYDFLTQRLGFKLVSYRTNADGSTASDIALAPLALGGLTDGVTVREMAGAYSSFINEGVYAESRTYSKVLTSDGEVLMDNAPKEELGFRNVRTAYYMLECMQGVTSYGTASGATISGVQTAGKTGTTSANYDRWFCGVTPQYSGAVWFGFEKQYTLTGLYGNPAANMWTKIMRRVHEGDSGLVFDSHPEDFETASYCMDTGLAPSAACRWAGRVATGRFWKGQVPTEVCSHENIEGYSFGKNGISGGYGDAGDTGDDDSSSNSDDDDNDDDDSSGGNTGGTTDPGGTDPGGTNPGGTDPGGTDPGGTDPGGSDPGGTDPGGSDPGGSDPGGTTDPPVGPTDPEV